MKQYLKRHFILVLRFGRRSFMTLSKYDWWKFNHLIRVGHTLTRGSLHCKKCVACHLSNLRWCVKYKTFWGQISKLFILYMDTRLRVNEGRQPSEVNRLDNDRQINVPDDSILKLICRPKYGRNYPDYAYASARVVTLQIAQLWLSSLFLHLPAQWRIHND